MTAQAKASSTSLKPRPHAAWLTALPLAAAFAALSAATAQAEPCLPINQKLLPLPELRSNPNTHVLKGTILLTSEQRRLIFRAPGTVPGQPGVNCQEQRVRAFIGVEAMPKVPPSPGNINDPYPGPLLRARLGDIVQLTFVNQIDPNRFGKSIDMGEKRFLNQFIPSAGCDISSPGNPAAGYPLAGGDAWPDCFHGSSTGNIHFHGTHTNPDGTADNVLVEVRPSPRDPATRNPQFTPESANKAFADFFKACETNLRGDVFSTYPQTWMEKPLGPYTQKGTWTYDQAALLQAYDAQMKQGLWDSNQAAIAKNQWPQYYIGAYPYCFQIPEYKEANWPPPPGGLRMGQSPGTHWYHAHKHGSTAINVANGMTGVFIIEGDYDDRLKTFYGPGFKERVMVINQLGVSPNLLRVPNPQGGPGPGSQDKGPDFSVNGRAQPLIEMAPGEVQMWRIANTSGRSGAFFNPFPNGFEFMQTGQDGVQLTYENAVRKGNKTFMMAAGNRVDLLVKAPMIPGNYNILVQHAVDPADLGGKNPAIPVPLVQVSVSGTPAQGNLSNLIDKDHYPKQPRFLTNITDEEVGSTQNTPRVITFATSGPNFPAPVGQAYGQHTINGQKFQDGQDVPIGVNLNTAEEWRIENWTFGPPISHPFHIHINPFQIVEVFDPNATVTVPNKGVLNKYIYDGSTLTDAALQCAVNPQDKTTWKDCHNDTSDDPRIWWDVFPIPSGTVQNNVPIPGYFRLRSRFVDFAGQYVLHCHILAHEDRGMMAMVVVSSPTKQYDPKIYKHH